mmetsp:Transcript_125629/g.250675  ORF Transcript_125629/g.250675 Transcript_125629/m.250675 type:complete len:104 (+) Transcript_125629:132-443(+)
MVVVRVQRPSLKHAAQLQSLRFAAQLQPLIRMAAVLKCPALPLFPVHRWQPRTVTVPAVASTPLQALVEPLEALLCTVLFWSAERLIRRVNDYNRKREQPLPL